LVVAVGVSDGEGVGDGVSVDVGGADGKLDVAEAVGATVGEPAASVGVMTAGFTTPVWAEPKRGPALSDITHPALKSPVVVGVLLDRPGVSVAAGEHLPEQTLQCRLQAVGRFMQELQEFHIAGSREIEGELFLSRFSLCVMGSFLCFLKDLDRRPGCRPPRGSRRPACRSTHR